MLTIHLIRHGQKESHPGNPALTPLGILQAQQTGKYLTQFPISEIISSPYKRTQETAQYIGKQLNLGFTTNELLKERINWDSTLISKETFLSEVTKTTNDRNYIPKWGDSSKSAGERIQKLIKSLDLKRKRHIVLISHGSVITDFLRNIFKDEAIATLKKQSDNGLHYQMLNCAINTIVVTDRLTIKAINFVGHLKQISEF